MLMPAPAHEGGCPPFLSAPRLLLSVFFWYPEGLAVLQRQAARGARLSRTRRHRNCRMSNCNSPSQMPVTVFSYVVRGDFNSQLDIEVCGDLLDHFCEACNLLVLNKHAPVHESWTFESSFGVRKRIDFLLCHVSIFVQAAVASHESDMGSDPNRAIYGRIDATPNHKAHVRRPRRRRGWRLNSQTGRLHQSILHDRLHHTKPQNHWAT